MRGTFTDQALIYLQVAQMLEDDILRGLYREDDQVPSTNELARGYHINPATAGKGMNLLVEEGILYKRRGLGMFVSPGAAGLVREKRKKVFYDDYIRPMVKEGRTLGLNHGQLQDMVARASEEGEETK